MGSKNLPQTTVTEKDVHSWNDIEQLKLEIVNSSDNIDEKGRKKRKILDEEEYTSIIEHIIEKDFFPDVPKMKLELEYDDAISKNDYERINKLSREKIEQKNKEKSNDDNLECFDTPLNGSNEIEVQKNDSIKNEADPKTLSLNKFLNEFTSEDNNSFERLQEKTLKKHIEKIDFLNGDSQLHNEKLENSLVLPSIETQQMIKNDKNDCSGNKMVTWKHSNKNTVMFDPEGVPMTKQEAEKLKSRQIIIHENTRFKLNPFNASRVNVLPNVTNPLKLGKIGVDGKEVNSQATPSVNGFSFVPSTPCLKPENLLNSPLMTWGVIEATPINLKGDTTPLIHTSNFHFKIPEIPKKEVIGQELANRILSKKRHHHNVTNLNSPLMKGNQKSSIDRLNSMSPAAQLLATKKLGLHQHMDRSLQASYSPLMTSVRTPTPRQIVTPTPTNLVLVSTPKSSSPSNSKDYVSQRPKAAEFF